MTDVATTDVAIRVENLGKQYQLGPQKSSDFPVRMPGVLCIKAGSEFHRSKVGCIGINGLIPLLFAI